MSHSEVKKMIRSLKKKGYAIECTRNGHYKVTHPQGGFIIISSSPSDCWWKKNVEGDIKRLEKSHGPTS